MRIEILNDQGQTINTIEADASFAEAVFPGKWRAVGSAVVTPVPVRRRLSTLAFRDRFTQAEKVAIYTAAKSSIEVQIWLDDLAAATPESDGTAVDLDDPRTIADVQALEVAGLIGAGRAAQVLA